METCCERWMAATETENIHTYPTASRARRRLLLLFSSVSETVLQGRAPTPLHLFGILRSPDFSLLSRDRGVNSKDASVLLAGRKGGNWAMYFLGNCNRIPAPAFMCWYLHQAAQPMHCRPANENAAEATRSRLLLCACTTCTWLHTEIALVQYSWGNALKDCVTTVQYINPEQYSIWSFMFCKDLGSAYL